MELTAEFAIRLRGGGVLELGRRTRVMAILNVTPDSFSDGGRLSGARAAVDEAGRMVDAGCDIIDVGGESTRPGAAAVEATVEADRVLPVIEGIKRACGIPVSVDTMKATVARQALEAGADLINDVSSLEDPQMLPVLRQHEAPVVLMHMRGTPRSMQRDTRYEDITTEVTDFLADRAQAAIDGGLSGDKILVDPGIGFGKSVSGNLKLLRDIPALRRLGRPILVGASRKSFIGAVLDLPVHDRLEGSLAVAVFASVMGAHVVRVHDVAATVRAMRMTDAIRHA